MRESDYIAVHDLATLRSALADLGRITPSSTAEVLGEVGPLKGEVDVEVWVASWREAVGKIHKVMRDLEENVTARMTDACVVCGAELVPSTVPPHCEDCVVPEESEP